MSRWQHFLLVGIIAACGTGHGQYAHASLQPLDTFSLVQATFPTISADSHWVAYVQVTRDLNSDLRIRHIEISKDGGAWFELKDTTGCFYMRWAPTQPTLALLCRRGERTTLELRSLPADLRTVIEQDALSISDMSWSRDGSWLAFEKFVVDRTPAVVGEQIRAPNGADWARPFKTVVRTPRELVSWDSMGASGSYQTFVVPTTGSSPPRQISSGLWWMGRTEGVSRAGPDLAWSKDGSEVLVSGSRVDNPAMAEFDQRHIYAIGVSEGRTRELATAGSAVGGTTISPDGKWIAYSAVDERGLSVQNRHIYVMPAAGGASRVIGAALDRSIDQFEWLSAGEGFTVTYEDGGLRRISHLYLDGRVTALTNDVGGDTLELPYSFASYVSFSTATSGTVVYVRSSSTEPSNIVSLQRDGTVHQLTKLNEALSARVGGFSRAEPFWVKASTDGEPIQAWVMRSAAVTKGERGPIIMDIHGGPYAQCGDRFSIKYQLFLAAGYSVVYANPRGSTGYGEKFGNLAHNAWPGHDGTDLLDVLEAVKNRDFVDPNRVFVTGTSGGGTMSLWILAHSAHVQAAVSVKPLTDWISWTFTSDLGFQIYRHWMGNKLPWPKVDDYWNRSVLSLVPLIHAPVLLISGDDDRRAPPDQALEMFTALSLCGSPVALIRGPNVTHNSSDYRPSMFLQEAASTIGWFSESTTNPPPLPGNRRCHM